MIDWIPCLYCHQAINIDDDCDKIDDPDRYWLGVCVEALPVIGLAIALAVSL